MKAWVISDIHTVPLDYYRARIAIPDADICICAGDTTDTIYTTLDFLLAEIASKMPVVTVLGNHDFYRSSIDRALEVATERLDGTNVHLLENGTTVLSGVRFIGATLWTDFEVPHGTQDNGPELSLEARRDLAFHICIRDIMDFRQIYRSDERKPGETGLITVEEMIRRHKTSRAYIEGELAKPFAGKTVVLTHHAPSPRSLHPAYQGNPTNAAFASDLTETIRDGRPWYWVHGHIHHFSDYTEGHTRVLCNPKGYRHELGTSGFRPGFVIEL